LKRLRDRSGGLDAEMDVAERQLASARFRLAQVEDKTEETERQLRRLEEIAGRELERARRVDSEVEDNTYRLLKARYLLARVKGDKVQSVERLRDLAALTKATLARLRSLQLKGASSEEEIDWPHYLDLRVQQRLAQAEAKTKRILEIQEQLVSLTGQMVQRVLRSPNRTQEEIAYLKWVQALQRYRLVQAQHGQLPEYESIWELDGWTQLRHQPRG
jgi:chromosome segregation ATPase